MNAVELTNKAMHAAKCTSTHQLAKELGVSHVAIGKWLRGETCPSFEQACELAVMAGLPPVSTAAQVRQGSIDGAKHRVILRRLAQIAAVLVLSTAALPATHAKPVDAGSCAHNSVGTVYYVKLRKLVRSVGVRLLGS